MSRYYQFEEWEMENFQNEKTLPSDVLVRVFLTLILGTSISSNWDSSPVILAIHEEVSPLAVAVTPANVD